MRLIFKEWMKDKRAFSMLLASYVLSIIYLGINSQVLIWIADAVNYPDNITTNLVRLVVALIVQTILSTLSGYLGPMGRNREFTTLSNLYADYVLSADVRMFNKHSTAGVITSAEFLWSVCTAMGTVMSMVTNLFYIAFSLIGICRLAGAVVLPVIAIYAIATVIIRKLFSHYERLSSEAHDEKKKRNQELENIVNGFAEVRTFGTSEFHKARFHAYNTKIYGIHRRTSSLNSLISAVINIVDSIGLVITIIFGVRQILSGLLQPADGVALVMFIYRLIDPLTGILDGVDNLSRDLASVKKYCEVADFKNEKRPEPTVSLESFESSIELKNVSFAYDKSSDCIHDVSMRIPKGKKIGICGTSGAGKSTIFKLLNRFYMVKEGQILIDGVDINLITPESYTQHVGSVHQENTVFPGTIWDNVTYGSQDFTEEDVIEACEKAGLLGFINSLKKKFDTQVGSRGLNLSGGQKQRIALARLFLKDPDIILLDEATSALDNETETLVQEALDKLRGKTVITVAHRLSTIENSDIIYVMGAEGILESGTHDELMALRGAYFKMRK